MGTIKYSIILVLIGLMSFQPSQDYETILWDANRRLSWSDFRGEVPINARAAAITASGITYRFSTSGTKENIKVAFKVDAFFYPTKSWYQPKICDAIILSHEQLHFDISELYARKLKKRLMAESYTYSNVRSKVKIIYSDINKELNDFQNQYDDETNFSRDRERQQEWILKIEKALVEHE